MAGTQHSRGHLAQADTQATVAATSAPLPSAPPFPRPTSLHTRHGGLEGRCG